MHIRGVTKKSIWGYEVTTLFLYMNKGLLLLLPITIMFLSACQRIEEEWANESDIKFKASVFEEYCDTKTQLDGSSLSNLERYITWDSSDKYWFSMQRIR